MAFQTLQTLRLKGSKSYSPEMYSSNTKSPKARSPKSRSPKSRSFKSRSLKSKSPNAPKSKTKLKSKSKSILTKESMDENYVYWAHLDDESEIAELTAKSGTMHATQLDILQKGNLGNDQMGGNEQIDEKKEDSPLDQLHVFGNNIPHRFVVLKKDPYEFVDDIGSGGFGVVYKMRDPKDGSIVAVKKIDLKKMCRKLEKKITELESVKAKAETEMKIMRKCDQRNIVPILNDYYLESKKTICLVMPYYEGGNLAEFMHEQFDQVDAQRFAKQIWKGLEYLHNQNPPIIHRDLKPENILLSERSTAATLLITDFGTSKFKENVEKDTELLSIVGTRGRMAPEIGVQKCPYRSNVDLWNFGLIVCEMVVGPNNFSEMKSSGKYNLDKHEMDKECRTLLNILLDKDAKKRQWEFVKQNGWLK